MVNLAAAKARLSELVSAAEKGEEIVITRHGHAVARLVPAEKPLKPFPLAELAAFRATLPFQAISSAALIRAMRDEED